MSFIIIASSQENIICIILPVSLVGRLQPCDISSYVAGSLPMVLWLNFPQEVSRYLGSVFSFCRAVSVMLGRIEIPLHLHIQERSV